MTHSEKIYLSHPLNKITASFSESKRFFFKTQIIQIKNNKLLTILMTDRFWIFFK